MSARTIQPRVISARPGPGAWLASGQALAEFALVFPVLLVMVLGVLDAGRFVYMNSVLSQAAREGARLAAAEAGWVGKTIADDPSCVSSAAQITGSNPGAHVCPANTTTLASDALAPANRMVTPFGNIASSSFYISCDTASAGAPTGAWTTGGDCAVNGATGNLVSVRVLMTFAPITPVIGQLLGQITSSGSATMVIN